MKCGCQMETQLYTPIPRKSKHFSFLDSYCFRRILDPDSNIGVCFFNANQSKKKTAKIRGFNSMLTLSTHMYLFNSIFQCFTWFESRNFACSDFDFFTSLWVAPFTCSTLTNLKVTKTNQLYFITSF